MQTTTPPPGSFLTPEEVLAVYRRRAKRYDLSANLYYLIGFREQAYRRMAIEALALGPGDTVVEIGCGTGLNFGLLQDRIGPDGRLIGVDPSPEMLAQARKRLERHAWTNVELVQCSGAAYEFPRNLDGILSTFALTLEPDYEGVIARGASTLRPGHRWVILDLKLPTTWLRHLAPIFVFLVRPFAVSMELAKRHPWEAMERLLSDVSIREVFFGFAYVAKGEAK